MYKQTHGAHCSVSLLITAHAVPFRCARCWFPVRFSRESHETSIYPFRAVSPMRTCLPPLTLFPSLTCCPALIHFLPPPCSLTRVLVSISTEGVITVTGSCRDETCGSPEIISQGLITGTVFEIQELDQHTMTVRQVEESQLAC